MFSLFRNKVYFAVTVGHFIIDIFSSSGPVLVTFLSVPLGLSTAQIGLAVGSYQLFGGLTQPLFGWIADKIGSRWLGPGSVAWTITFLLLSIFAAQQTGNFNLFLLFYVLASIGSSAFHPLGTKHAADESVKRAAAGTAVFFLFGQSGLATGPVFTGFILDNSGVVGLYLLGVLTIPHIIFMVYAMRSTTIDRVAAASTTSPAVDAKIAVRWGAIGLLALLIGLRSWAFLGTVTFLPKLFQDMGWTATSYGLITGIYWMASAITGVVAGNFADRFGRRQVVFVTMLAGSIPLYFLPLSGGWQAFPLAIISGGLMGASHSILVVIAQAVLPGKKAFASGVTLGYLFAMGAIAAWVMGFLADIFGLTVVVQAGSVVGIAAALLALALPATREELQSQPKSALM